MPPKGVWSAADTALGKAVCERPFALHRQQPEKDKQNFNVVPVLANFLRTPMNAMISI